MICHNSFYIHRHMPLLHDLSLTTLITAGIAGAVILLFVVLLIRRQVLLKKHRRMRAMVYKQRAMSGEGPTHNVQQLIDLLYDLLNDDPDVQHQQVYNTLLLTARQLLTPVAKGSTEVTGVADTSGTARVSGNADTSGIANTSGNSGVTGSACISSNSQSSSSARVSGNADISGTANTSGNSGVTGSARISGSSQSSGSARASGNADISGTANTSGNSGVTGSARVSGSSNITGTAHNAGTTRVSGNSDISGTANMSVTAETTTPASAPATTPEGVSAAVDGPRLAIVLVDLSEELTQIVIQLAGKYAHLILSTTASDALDAIVRADPTLIICVNSTPCSALATTIKQDIFLSHIPIIAIALTDDAIVANEVIPIATAPTDLEHALSRLAGVPLPTAIAPPAQPTHSSNTNRIVITERPTSDDTPPADPVLTVSDAQLLTQLREAIQRHLADSTLNAETLSQELGIPKNTILIKVKEITGHTITKLIHQERLAIAATLLRENHLPVDAIAEQVGYTNFNAFAAAFKDEYHVSPYAFRHD